MCHNLFERWSVLSVWCFQILAQVRIRSNCRVILFSPQPTHPNPIQPRFYFHHNYLSKGNKSFFLFFELSLDFGVFWILPLLFSKSMKAINYCKGENFPLWALRRILKNRCLILYAVHKITKTFDQPMAQRAFLKDNLDEYKLILRNECLVFSQISPNLIVSVMLNLRIFQYVLISKSGVGRCGYLVTMVTGWVPKKFIIWLPLLIPNRPIWRKLVTDGNQ